MNDRRCISRRRKKEREREREREIRRERRSALVVRASEFPENVSESRLARVGIPRQGTGGKGARRRRRGGRESVRTRRARSAVTVTDRGTRSFPERSRRTHGTVCRLSSLDVRPIARLAASGSARDVTNAVTASRASFPRRGGREGGCAHGAVAGAPRRARFVLPTISRQLSNCAGTQLIMRPREIGAR